MLTSKEGEMGETILFLAATLTVRTRQYQKCRQRLARTNSISDMLDIGVVQF
jgi:hypothetical protein